MPSRFLPVARFPRRVFVWPTVLLLETWLLLVSPVVLAVAGLFSALRRDSRALRVSALVLAWAAVEPYAIARLARMRAAGAGPQEWEAFVGWFVQTLYTGIRVLLDVHLELDPSSPTPDDVGRAPLVVLARHSGPGDPFLLAWLLAVHYRLRLRVIAKAALRLEPAVDLAGEAAGICFVRGVLQRPRRGTGLAAITDVARSLQPRDALLIFPEGQNFSARRRREALAGLREAGEWLKAHRASRLRRVLPPRTRGTAAALGAAPGTDVLVVVHSGFGASGRPWWRLPIHETVRVRAWLRPAADVPRDAAALDRWLLDEWARVDGWLADAGVAAVPLAESR